MLSCRFDVLCSLFRRVLKPILLASTSGGRTRGRGEKFKPLMEETIPVLRLQIVCSRSRASLGFKRSAAPRRNTLYSPTTLLKKQSSKANTTPAICCNLAREQTNYTTMGTVNHSRSPNNRGKKKAAAAEPKPKPTINMVRNSSI